MALVSCMSVAQYMIHRSETELMGEWCFVYFWKVLTRFSDTKVGFRYSSWYPLNFILFSGDGTSREKNGKRFTLRMQPVQSYLCFPVVLFLFLGIFVLYLFLGSLILISRISKIPQSLVQNLKNSKTYK